MKILYRIASDPHFRHALSTRDLEPNSVTILRQVNVWSDFASPKIDNVCWWLGAVHFLATFIKLELQIPASEPISLEGLECKALWFEKP